MKRFLNLLPLGVLLFFLSPSLAQTQLKDTLHILFETDKARIQPDEAKKLDLFYQNLHPTYTWAIELTGHTDADGSDQYNDRLSENRVHAVQQYLIDLGVPPSAISTDYQGEQNPLADNNTESGKQRNRRVLVVATTNLPKRTVQEYTTAPPKKYSASPPALYAEPDRSIYGPDGTIVIIPGGAFAPYTNAEINVELTEAIRLEDMLRLGLPTITVNNECLQTSGMVFLTVTGPNGESLQTNPNLPMIVRIPVDEWDEDVEIYTGLGNGTTVRGWEETAQKPTPVTENGQDFFEFEVPGSAAVNLDKPTGITAQQDPRPYFLTRGFDRDEARACLSGEQVVATSDFYKNKKFRFRGMNCISESARMVTVFAEKKGQVYVLHKPLSALTYQNRWLFGSGGRYVIKKKDYLPLESSEQLEALLAMQ